MTLWWARRNGWDVRPLTFHYFNRPKAEVRAIGALLPAAEIQGVREVDLPFLMEIDDMRKQGVAFDNRELTRSPEGYIPARNLIFYALAAHYAELDRARWVIGGHNGTDPEQFPDSSPKFFNFVNSLYRLGIWSYGTSPMHVLLPLSGKTKVEVVRLGLELEVPFADTWSCFWDGDVHCGTCVSCRERRDAFAALGVEDPVPYRSQPGGDEAL